MSTQQIRKRLEKLEETIRPVEALRALWRHDRQKYLKMANGNYHFLRWGISQFQREDAAGRQNRSSSRP
jgi:hypothetical protein